MMQNENWPVPEWRTTDPEMCIRDRQYALADIQKIFMLPDDNSSKTGEPAISNDEIAQLAACDSDFFIGFAAADPGNKDGADELRRAFGELGLKGLYVNTCLLYTSRCV